VVFLENFIDVVLMSNFMNFVAMDSMLALPLTPRWQGIIKEANLVPFDMWI
jgi:hypothetical protein